ncbi:MAG: hypothetical protein ACLQK4_13975 [Acidimicrobiales bacterium]
MSDYSLGPGWWLASDGRWYPPETHPDAATRRAEAALNDLFTAATLAGSPAARAPGDAVLAGQLTQGSKDEAHLGPYGFGGQEQSGPAPADHPPTSSPATAASGGDWPRVADDPTASDFFTLSAKRPRRKRALRRSS